MKTLISSLLIICGLFACSSTNPKVEPTTSNNPSTEQIQYGTPFANVPSTRNATIYQVNIRAFSSQGNFKGVVARLDSIKALGINVIYLMPIYPLGIVKGINSPYCISDYTAVNAEFGTLDDLRSVVDGAHTRNMAVILDWVANHTAWDHKWISSNKSWYLQDANGNVVSPPNMGWNDVAQLNFNNADMRLEMIKSMKYWVYASNVDGFRCDYSDGPTVAFWKQAIDTLKKISTHKLLLLSEGTRSANFSAGFDYNFGFRFFDRLKSIYKSNESVKLLEDLNTSEYTGTTTDQLMVRYITNHDVNGSDGTPLDLFGGKKGSMAAFVTVAYMKSVPMIYSGQEVGTSFRIPFPFTSVNIDWSVNPDVTAEYKKVIAFRNSSQAIKYGELKAFSSTDVCAFTKEVAAEKVLVLSNLRNKVVTFTLPTEVANSSWKNAMENDIAFTTTTQVDLQPYSYLILKK
jgi:glycosidase